MDALRRIGALAALAAVGVASAAATVLLLGGRAPAVGGPPAAGAPGPCAPAPDAGPRERLELFVSTAVERRQLGRSYRLVGERLRQRLSCRQWLTGTIPVVPVHGVRDVALLPRGRERGDLVYLVRLLAGDGGRPAAYWFWAVLERGTDGWLVGEWVPATTFSAPAG